MRIEADAEYVSKTGRNHEDHLSFLIGGGATEAQVNGELTLEALKHAEKLMGSSSRDLDTIELSNIHQTLVEYEKREE